MMPKRAQTAFLHIVDVVKNRNDQSRLCRNITKITYPLSGRITYIRCGRREPDSFERIFCPGCKPYKETEQKCWWVVKVSTQTNFHVPEGSVKRRISLDLNGKVMK